MPNRRLKTEHCGPKKGRGAYFGHKADAKKESSQKRRQRGRNEAVVELAKYQGNAQ